MQIFNIFAKYYAITSLIIEVMFELAKTRLDKKMSGFDEKSVVINKMRRQNMF